MKRVSSLAKLLRAPFFAATILLLLLSLPHATTARAAAAAASSSAPDGAGIRQRRRAARRPLKKQRRRAALPPTPEGTSTTMPATAVARPGNAGWVEDGAAVAKAIVVEEIKEARLTELLRRDGGAGAAAPARPLLVNFWATWCEPCRKEFPDLVRIDEEFRARGLEFITISIDDVSEIRSGVPQFLREMKAERMPAYLLNADDPEKAISMVDAAWRGELPATFLYDRRGKLVFKHMGRINREELRTAVKAVTSDE